MRCSSILRRSSTGRYFQSLTFASIHNSSSISRSALSMVFAPCLDILFYVGKPFCEIFRWFCEQRPPGQFPSGPSKVGQRKNHITQFVFQSVPCLHSPAPLRNSFSSSRILAITAWGLFQSNPTFDAFCCNLNRFQHRRHGSGNIIE